jgi:hypothetical protein
MNKALSLLYYSNGLAVYEGNEDEGFGDENSQK